MYFSKIALRRDVDLYGYVARNIMQDGYRLHQTLWQLFKTRDHQGRDFLYRRVETVALPCFYIVSARHPVDEQGLWGIQIKDYTPKLLTGQRLAFSLRANPIVTKPSRHGKPTRHDVIMDAKRQLKAQQASIHQAEVIQEKGRSWLETRADKHGFHLEQVRVDSYRQHRLQKGRSGSPIRYSTVDFNGILTVTNPEQFFQTLCTGIGPAKGFGCGLLLVRRV